MSLTEKTAYLKGLYDGMGLNEESSREARMLGAIVDVLQELAEHVEENEDSIAVLDDELCDLSASMEDDDDDDFYDDDDEDYEKLYALGDGDRDEDEDEDLEELELPAEIPCPNCGEPLTISADELVAGEIVCPHCGKELEIEVEARDEDDDDIPF